MKKLLLSTLSVSLLSLMLITKTAVSVHAQDVSVSYQVFYDNLAPYGQWVNDPEYGNVWVPNEGGNFRPYGTGGHWAMTDYGNTWVSDYQWGWAPYHYGRWTYDNYYGWVWIPGYEWAPAWVSWRYGGGYSGWAPLGPGVSISVGYNCPESWWIFVEPQYMYHHDFYGRWRGPSYNNNYIQHTTVINNYYVDNGSHVGYNYGPRAEVIQRDTHQPVQVYHVSPQNRPGATQINGDRVNVYRPNVDRNGNNNARPVNVINAPRPVGKPQPAINTGSQPAFRQPGQNMKPAPQRDAPTLQPPRQAPAQQPQRPTPTPQQQPQRPTPTPQQQPQRQDPTPQQQPQRQAPPQQQPQGPAPTPQQQPQRPDRAPQQQPQRQAPPQQQPQRQAPPPQQQPQRQAPAPQQQPQRQAPPQPQRQAPQQQPQHQAPPPPRQAPPQQQHQEGERR